MPIGSSLQPGPLGHRAPSLQSSSPARETCGRPSDYRQTIHQSWMIQWMSHAGIPSGSRGVIVYYGVILFLLVVVVDDDDAYM